ncbi:glycosyltransferase family 4 protein [Clostridium gasigenes]|uniref:glycosyltransferase family 4 protein n=1 Tax=Clostridium gasigenes TaxID=94869 RepID=UPI00162671E9|nr:glycosyltransferase family 4 protein [Clostridium gasigenes]MBB6624109.1 glycosyltransferase family 4 protein [Clostridium gasigenes]
MVVLLVSNMYPSKEYPSYGVFVRNFEDSLLENNIKVNKTILVKQSNRFKKLYKYIVFYLDIIFKCIIGKYDIVYVHYASHAAIPILIASKFKKFNLFVNVHGSDVMPEKKSQQKYQKYVKKLMNISNKIIVPSKYFKDIVTAKYNVDNNNIFVSASGGVNKEKFYYIEDKSNIKEKYGIKNKSTIIGYVGRLDIGKGWDTYIKAIKILKDNDKLRNIIFIVVGSGAEKEQFKNMIKEFELEKHIINYDLLPQKELNNIYNMLDIFCFPTTRKGESLGLVGLEAMMCGVPILGSRIGALPEYIDEEGTGMLFEVGNQSELAEKILALSNQLETDKQVKNLYRKRCIEKANEYRSDKVNKELYEILYKELR